MSRFLFLTQLYPSGLSGTSVKTRHTIEYLLQKGHWVDVVCVHHVTMVVPTDFNHPHLRIYIVPAQVMSSFNVLYLIKHVGLLFSRTPFRVRKLFFSQFLETTITLLYSHLYDTVFIDGYAMLQYLPLIHRRLGSMPSQLSRQQFAQSCTYIDDEDIADLMWQRARTTNNIVLAVFFYSEYIKCLWYEKKVLPLVARIWAISDRTAQRLQRVVNTPTVVMPTVVPVRDSCFSIRSKAIVFTGLLSWMENVVGLEWFLDKVWPLVHEKVPAATMIVAGQMAKPALIAKLQRYPNLSYKGYVPDLRTIYRRSAVAIAPIMINCGIKVKTVTYLSYGLPVVSTTAATWGLGSLDGVRTADTAEQFATELIALLTKHSFRSKLAAAASANARTHHSARNLHRFFQKVGLVAS